MRQAFPLPLWAGGWARAARLVERLRVDGYPAPRYFGTGATSSAVWSLQELLAGVTPSSGLSGTHARQLIDLARRHVDTAGEHKKWTKPARDLRPGGGAPHGP